MTKVIDMIIITTSIRIEKGKAASSPLNSIVREKNEEKMMGLDNL